MAHSNVLIPDNEDVLQIIDNSYEACEQYGFHWGYSFYDVPKEMLQEVLNGKILAMNDGEYSTFIRLKESEELHGK